ncbi:glycosyltransferase family 4 protein [Clostridium omnivorum]|uniref:Group 1 glycosyl transferase n=1 Tax=Clostridium omnivorum TaxID=1604902 RepID=A0ABQ5N3T4_9CLOT|nr:glycosyltransferase family 1 protein [Clostridium sp. E14]GLC29710.1 group 1 glycosyl transferase [Clostridium sp. E14]
MNKQLVVIDGAYLFGPLNGINRYSREVVLAIDSLESRGKYIFQIVVPENLKVEVKFKNIEVVGINTSILKCDEASLRGWTRKCAEPYARRHKAYFMNFTGSVPLLLKGYTCLHDIRPICFDREKVGRKPRFFKIKFIINSIFAKLLGSKIVTLTEYSKKTIVDYLKIKSKNISVNACGWEHIEGTIEDISIFDKLTNVVPGQYYFSLGSLAPHKNYRWILEVARRNPKCVFVIAGGKELDVWDDNQQVKESNIIYTGRISDDEMKALLKGCKMLLFPSLFEGFGLPPLEALALGKKVAVASSSCLPEVFEDTVSYFNPYDYDVNLNELYRQEVDSPSKILEKYTWHNNALNWIKLLDEL